MYHVTSADSTQIAVTRVGDGPAVVIVNGAFSTAADAVPLAEALAATGALAVTYDRRARGSSGNTRPYSPEREADDLRAVIESIGQPAAVLGHSSGAVLALFAASIGVPVAHLFLSEPPFRFGENQPAADLPDRLQALVDEGRLGDAVVLFQREGVGLPDDVIDQIRASQMFDGLVGLAQSTVYDATLTRDVSTPTPQMLQVPMPVTVLCGSDTFPFLAAAARRLASSIPHAEFIEVRESVGHGLHPEATAHTVLTRLAD